MSISRAKGLNKCFIAESLGAKSQEHKCDMHFVILTITVPHVGKPCVVLCIVCV